MWKLTNHMSTTHLNRCGPHRTEKFAPQSTQPRDPILVTILFHICILPSATKLLRLCFHRRVSVRGGGVTGHGGCAWSQGGVPSPGGGCLVPWGVCPQRGGGWLVPGGALSHGGCLSQGGYLVWGGCLSQRGVPGLGVCLVPGGGGLLLGGAWSRGGGGIRACTEADPPRRDGYCCGRYASYWNAFLFFFLYSQLVRVCTTIHSLHNP